MTGTEVTGISDDRYRSTMGVIVISLEALWSAGENFGCTWECRRTNAWITNKLWELPGFWCIFIRRTAGVIWDSADVHEQSTSRNSEYDALIIVNYHFWIILAVIILNIVFCASLHQGNKRKRWKIQKYTQVHWNNNPTKQSKNVNQTWCRCHPLHPPSHQGQWKQEHRIHQRCTEAGGAPCICWLFVPGEWMKENSNVVWLNLWHITKV